ncbi:hypothetical protein UlMin_015595 [Ulmus minor]
MAVSLTHLSCWWWGRKDKEFVPNECSINSSLEWGFGLREPEILQFSFIRRTKLASTRRKVKRKWKSREEKRVEREFDMVLVPSDGVCLSYSESDGSYVFIGWIEPHGNGFQTDDEDKTAMSMGKGKFPDKEKKIYFFDFPKIPSCVRVLLTDSCSF